MPPKPTTTEPVAEAAPVEEVPLNPPGFGRPVGAEMPAPPEVAFTGPRFKVEPPRTSFEWGGLKVTDEWTPVPAELASGLRSAAQDVGVELTEEV